MQNTLSNKTHITVTPLLKTLQVVSLLSGSPCAIRPLIWWTFPHNTNWLSLQQHQFVLGPSQLRTIKHFSLQCSCPTLSCFLLSNSSPTSEPSLKVTDSEQHPLPQLGTNPSFILGVVYLVGPSNEDKHPSVQGISVLSLWCSLSFALCSFWIFWIESLTVYLFLLLFSFLCLFLSPCCISFILV